MYELLCRNRVEDYARWRKLFDTNAPAAREAGLQLTDLWRDMEDPNNIFFVFEVSSAEELVVPEDIATRVSGASFLDDGADQTHGLGGLRVVTRVD